VSLLPNTIDIFCRVIDNFGDIGVCWRLAQSLPEDCHIRLWVDELKSFHKIEPSVNPDLAQQHLKGVDIRHWHEAITDWQAADLVIEAFGCDLSQAYQEAMKGHTQCWLNLEYLSAEKWVEDFHLQPSVQANGVAKYFFFPGFTQKTGGLLRQHKTIDNPQQQDEFLKKLLPAESYAYYQDEKPLVINLFCYPYAPLNALLQALPPQQAVMIILAESVAPQLESIATRLQSNCYIQRLNFIVQEDYDCLLQVADINLVRGEDSFVQAHWSAKPMLWHIYPQEEAQHLVKLEAWLDSIQAPDWLRQLNRLWNYQADDGLNAKQAAEFITLFNSYAFKATTATEWQHFQENLVERLRKIPDLSQQIINFYEQCLKKS
jgi:uncharacterized repeat protein (TIGR03837 family)